jgi:hypothetical protein
MRPQAHHTQTPNMEEEDACEDTCTASHSTTSSPHANTHTTQKHIPWQTTQGSTQQYRHPTCEEEDTCKHTYLGKPLRVALIEILPLTIIFHVPPRCSLLLGVAGAELNPTGRVFLRLQDMAVMVVLIRLALAQRGSSLIRLVLAKRRTVVVRMHSCLAVR